MDIKIICPGSIRMTKNTFKGGAKKAKRKNLKGEAKQNARIKKLEQLIIPSIERKSKDQVNAGWTVSSSGRANYPMFALEQGDENNQRIGDKVTLMSHQISLTAAAQDTTNSIRLLFVACPSNQVLGITNVLEYGSYQTHGDLVFSSPYKRKAVTSEATYKVLFDKVYHFEADRRLLTDKFILKPGGAKGRQCSFNTTGNSMPENYQLIMMAISDSTAAPDPALNVVVRSKYIDL